MFYVIDKEDKLSIFNDSKEIIETTRKYMPQLEGQLTLETDIVDAETLEAHPNKVIVDDIEIEIDVPDYEEVEEEYQEQVYDEDGNPVYDEDGNPVYETKTRIVLKPIMIEIIDEETGETILVPSTHKETITVKGLVLNPNYEEEEAEKERIRIANLSLTKREVFLALYKDKGITPEQIKVQITNPEALIEFEYANDYFRGNPLIDVIGQSLGYSSEDLDYLFEHKELPVKEVNE